MVYMSKIENILGDIFLVKQEMRPGWYLTALVVFGRDTIGVIDTGYENTPNDYIFPLVRDNGREISDINLIVNTHRDGDHIMGNKIIKEKTDAKIAAHNLELEAIPDVDVTLNDGDSVKIGNRLFMIIHTPGHRPGAICLYDEKDKLLITGDSVCGSREDLIRMEKKIYINSLQRLLKVDSDFMIMSHPFMPAGKNVLKGNEIQEMIQTSLDIADKLKY